MLIRDQIKAYCKVLGIFGSFIIEKPYCFLHMFLLNFCGNAPLLFWTHGLWRLVLKINPCPSVRPSIRPCTPRIFQIFLRIFPIFCISAEDNWAHCLSKMFSSGKRLIPDCRGLSVQRRCFLTFWPFLHNGSKDLPNFCMSVEDKRFHLLS